MSTNAPALERCLGVLADIRTSGTYDLTTLPVALRELRNLIQSTAPVDGSAPVESKGDGAAPHNGHRRSGAWRLGDPADATSAAPASTTFSVRLSWSGNT